MYQWRKLTEEDRAALLSWRQHLKRPWHSPPHFATGPGCFHLTAACYDHAEIIGCSVKRMQDFSEDLIRTLDQVGATLHAWCLLPNHYPLLLDVPDLKKTTSSLGLLHGRTSFAWNGEESQRGRKVWCAPSDREIRGEAHFWATLNYIHHNPVKHGWVTNWQHWPYSSAAEYLTSVGREEAVRLWKSYPILNYGSGWDD